jgi:hypothetical protein
MTPTGSAGAASCSRVSAYPKAGNLQLLGQHVGGPSTEPLGTHR